MFKINFSQNINCNVCIAKDLNFEDAIQFALNLHRSSNSEHCISVKDEYGHVRLTLSTLKK